MFLLEHAYYQAEVLKMIPFAQLRQTCLRKCVTRIHGRNSSSVALNPVNGLKIYNSLSKTKSPLFTKHPGSLSWYICGPTVYDVAHIGHAWCYVNFDLMRRVMEHYFDMNIIQVMNITDIDDKIINRANEQNLHFKEVAFKYESDFLNDMDTLSVKRPTIVTRVSDFIPQIISFIEKLLKQELAYKTEDGSVYFNLIRYSSTFKYGKLKPLQALENQAKDSASSNFALWKASKSPLEPSWVPSWGGKGRPGWHIECSAMASYVFGSWVDVHSGGIDLLFPHHENEEAQCCAYHENPQWVGHWIHANLLNFSDGAKMSKSLKNVITIKDFLEKYSADQFRMLCVLSSYRNGMDYADSSLNLAKDVLDSIQTFVTDCQSFLRSCAVSQPSIDACLLLNALEETRHAVKNHLGDDFNTAQATNAVRKLIVLTQKEMRKCTSNQNGTYHNNGVEVVACVLNFVSKYFSNLGFNFVSKLENKVGSDNTASVIDDFVEFRSQIRQHALAIKPNLVEKDQDLMITKKKFLKACDKLREDVKRKGILLKDHEKHTVWTRAIR